MDKKMFINFHIDDETSPIKMEIGKLANAFAKGLELKQKNFRLGRIEYF